jgi:hypothetical protein
MLLAAPDLDDSEYPLSYKFSDAKPLNEERGEEHETSEESNAENAS